MGTLLSALFLPQAVRKTTHFSSSFKQYFSSSRPLSSRPVFLLLSNLSPSPLQSWTISGVPCPDCFCRIIILQCCLPSSHLNPHHSRGDLGDDSCPWQSKNRLRDKVGDGMGRALLHDYLSQFVPCETAGLPLNP